MMRQELVQRRRWLSDQRFLDLLGATNLIPGPNSTEMSIHLGYLRAGWPGLVVGGFLFIAPAMVIVLALAWAYATFGALPQAQSLLYGIKPVVVAIVAQALYGLARAALKGPILIVAAAGVLVLYLVGVNELLLLFGGAAFAVLLKLVSGRLPRSGTVAPAFAAPSAAPLAASVVPAATAAVAATPFALSTLFLTFLKIGAVLYGSGYVLLAFLRGDFVERLGWLTDQQLLDAVSVGQFTPGPLFTTATFVGYLTASGAAAAGASGSTGVAVSHDVAAGVAGALLATLGIFLPSFLFVALSGPFVPRLRAWPLTGLLLDSVNATALGLMAAVTVELGRATLIDPLTILLAAASLAILLRWKPNSVWLILAGGVIGLAYRYLVP